MILISERCVDELGRIVLPAEARNSLGVAVKSKLNIYINGEDIILRKKNKTCKLCNSSDDIDANIGICNTCINKIKNI